MLVQQFTNKGLFPIIAAIEQFSLDKLRMEFLLSFETAVRDPKRTLPLRSCLRRSFHRSSPG